MSYLKYNLITGCLLAVILLSACETGERNTAKNFYDFDSLIQAQIHHLTLEKVSLHKEASINGHEEESTVTPADTTGWSRELDIFKQLNLINKPINKDNYEVRDKLNDPNSNLLIREYKSKKDIVLPYLRIYYQDKPENLIKVEGTYNEENALYSSSHHLTLELNKIDNKTMLTSFSIAGGQKMMMSDSVEFKITGTLLYED